MQKIFSTLCFIVCLVSFHSLYAQNCINPNPLCVPGLALSEPGFENPDSTPCIVQGVAYDHSVQILMYSAFGFGPNSVNVDSVEFVSIDNLPCGLCWGTSKPSNRYRANERGCVRIKGTTADTAGQYKMRIVLKAWIDGSTAPLPVNAGLVDAAGIKLFMRIMDPQASSCTPVDTSSSFAGNLGADCITAIADETTAISGIHIFPNPVTTASVFTFSTVATGIYHYSVADITGKIVWSSQQQLPAGENRLPLATQGFQPGMYFFTIASGNATVTQRFSVVQ